MLLDTNAFLLPVRSRFPLEAEVDRLRPGATWGVPSTVIEELERLVGRGIPGAAVALELARRHVVVPVEGRGDAAVFRAAVRRRAWVVTADRALASRLRQAGLPVLVPRDRHRLELRPARRPAGRSPLPGAPRKPGRRRQRL